MRSSTEAGSSRDLLIARHSLGMFRWKLPWPGTGKRCEGAGSCAPRGPASRPSTSAATVMQRAEGFMRASSLARRGWRRLEPGRSRQPAAFARLGEERRSGEMAAAVARELPAHHDAALARRNGSPQRDAQLPQQQGNAVRRLERERARAVERGPEELRPDVALAVAQRRIRYPRRGDALARDRPGKDAQPVA